MKIQIAIGIVATMAFSNASATCAFFEAPLGQVSTDLVAGKSQQPLLAPQWQANTVYVAGDQVQFDNKLYQARWWSKNEKPGPVWGSWELAAQDNLEWSAFSTYQLDDQVIYEGKVYRAQYWNANERPGDSGAWKLDELSNTLKNAQFVRSETDCGAPPYQDELGREVMVRSGSVGVQLQSEITDTIVFDHFFLYTNGEFQYSRKIEASIQNNWCKGQDECQALLEQGAQNVTYHPIYMYNTGFKSIDGVVVERTPPVKGYADVCTKDNICRRFEYNSEQP